MTEEVIKFTAPIIHLDEWTKDGRKLCSPKGGTVIHRPFPLSVRSIGGRRIGKINSLSVQKTVVYATGVLDATDSGYAMAHGLSSGSWFLEADCDQISEADVILHGRVDRMIEFRAWSLVCVTAGVNPCWDLGRSNIQWPNNEEV